MTDKSVPKDFLLRTNNEIFYKVLEEAKKENRSINNMINRLIEEALNKRK